jgi:hypothetical protein
MQGYIFFKKAKRGGGNKICTFRKFGEINQYFLEFYSKFMEFYRFKKNCSLKMQTKLTIMG